MGKAVAAGVLALAAGAVAVVGYVIMAVLGLAIATADSAETCLLPLGTAPVAAEDLDEIQLGHASTVIAVGIRRGETERAIVVALATVAQESRFLNYANDGTSPNLRPEQAGVVASLNYPHDAVGNDHGSIGIFQQQYPWWGSVAELMNPQIASEKFYDALGRVEGWESMSVTQAAQAVQRSAFPDAYAQWEPLARELLQSMPDADMAGLPACGLAGQVWDGEWTLPLAPGSYRISSGFGMRFHPILQEYRLHTGLDFAAAGGTPVVAAAAGEVTFAGWNNAYGNLIIVRTGEVEHWYAHLQTMAVSEQQHVSTGQEIGKVGTTGLSTGNHLHFEIRLNGTAVDPADFLRQQGIDPGGPS